MNRRLTKIQFSVNTKSATRQVTTYGILDETDKQLRYEEPVYPGSDRMVTRVLRKNRLGKVIKDDTFSTFVGMAECHVFVLTDDLDKSMLELYTVRVISLLSTSRANADRMIDALSKL